jgi:hypothetical protein
MRRNRHNSTQNHDNIARACARTKRKAHVCALCSPQNYKHESTERNNMLICSYVFGPATTETRHTKCMCVLCYYEAMCVLPSMPVSHIMFYPFAFISFHMFQKYLKNFAERGMAKNDVCFTMFFTATGEKQLHACIHRITRFRIKVVPWKFQMGVRSSYL